MDMHTIYHISADDTDAIISIPGNEQVRAISSSLHNVWSLCKGPGYLTKRRGLAQCVCAIVPVKLRNHLK